ncbi:oxygen-independent coproporphyrinogen III oxidase [Acidithiobacillus sp. CV18-2]|uniref:Coproporphyrinogen-III oxidase n=1 Tax=Igneacidithiobacillus copahuensis TaxID=2724909 RepID=A0AAE3CK36_9PROT|nr:oxygen-independent coproporphyrinogen III oxidase [Igneacidithiobacillus copahuensis]MBU2754637.1 oxygen-independent coproporphyrinogen III oxidase [Acidithiobacillus sp. CV18-3]MBU2757201.1 oxygen-independent coproporphyrinogen III oxidase [Acidithiobacillus sp. BN09-2]MBU2776770.1 oxygen-independent coproporphyrinogen III oxidase [Acidithiobacillus sp. CV18-2]MBU2795463.1 oxygen-independent coproporphyrinogen III oxidase [Acidithiobacillus sp. VAN18-2]MBU2799500.1 oxygen-independent copro
MGTETVLFDIDLIQRYDRPGPRYTSYPTAPQFAAEFDESALRAELRASNASGKPLSLYFHIPFCEHLCFYCACTKVVTRHREWGQPYVERLLREMALIRRDIDAQRPVTQLHFGGGTPTFLLRADLERLVNGIQAQFRLLDDDTGEYGIEVDPRAIEPGVLALLRNRGWNRLSMGVQDLDPAVQKAVHREQSLDLLAELIQEARSLGYRSISLDLIYGLPLQSPQSFAETLAQIISLRPDRLSLFNYAHLPERFPPQRRIRAEELPSPAQKLEILQQSIGALEAAGYVYIGMDHFALPEDELTRAQLQGHLYRNFQGYSTHSNADLLAFGMSAIAMVGPSYSQNRKDLEAWGAAVDAGRLPVERGLRLTADDLLRREVITRLICDFRLDVAVVEARHGIDFWRYFAESRGTLEALARDGLITLNEGGVTVLPAGRLLVRHVCMAFDAYLGRSQTQFSRVI